MSLPDQTPKLPKLPFLIGDAALLLAAWFIADHSRMPLGANATAAITACVAIGALLGVVPFLTDYARRQDEALDERQRGLEALSRTVNTAAEQISIAANGLNELTDLVHKNVKHAEQLPHKLQEKIAEFNAQLDNAREDDREELEKEVAELRASESEKLASAVDKIHKAVAELTKLDTAVQKQVSARSEQVERASAALVKAQTDVVTALHDAIAGMTKELSAAESRTLAAIETKLADGASGAVRAIEAATASAVEKLQSASPQPAAVTAPTTSAVQPETPSSDVASPPKKPRKPRREEASPESTPEPATSATEPTPAPAEEPPTTAVTDNPEISTPAAEPVIEPPVEPAPIPAESIPQITPVAPVSANPFPAEPSSAEPAPVAAPANEPPAETPPPAPKKRSRKATTEPANDLGLELEPEPSASGEESQVPAEPAERVLSSDGATRLIATAYIGIGNRLFIRGDGPGLSWDKGVPLQFVSIGKWRWEAMDATAPVTCKLYKNDEVECSALGTLTLDPGHQQEVTAKF